MGGTSNAGPSSATLLPPASAIPALPMNFDPTLYHRSDMSSGVDEHLITCYLTNNLVPNIPLMMSGTR